MKGCDELNKFIAKIEHAENGTTEEIAKLTDELKTNKNDYNTQVVKCADLLSTVKFIYAQLKAICNKESNSFKNQLSSKITEKN